MAAPSQDQMVSPAPAPTSPEAPTAELQGSGLVPGEYEFTIRTTDKSGAFTDHQFKIKVERTRNNVVYADTKLRTQETNLTYYSDTNVHGGIMTLDRMTTTTKLG